MNPNNIIRYGGLLKQTKRTGWLQFLPSHLVESVADHSYRMSLISLLFLEDEKINCSKCIQISILHDLAESIVGDITPHCGVSLSDKKEREEQAMQDILKDLPSSLRDKLYALWREYEDQSTLEGQLVKDIDKYEMIFQAFQYEEQNKVDLQQFYKSIEMIKNEMVRSWAQDLIDKRQLK